MIHSQVPGVEYAYINSNNDILIVQMGPPSSNSAMMYGQFMEEGGRLGPIDYVQHYLEANKFQPIAETVEDSSLGAPILPELITSTSEVVQNPFSTLETAVILLGITTLIVLPFVVLWSIFV